MTALKPEEMSMIIWRTINQKLISAINEWIAAEAEHSRQSVGKEAWDQAQDKYDLNVGLGIMNCPFNPTTTRTQLDHAKDMVEHWRSILEYATETFLKGIPPRS
jgi:hypothetical protein